MTEIKWTTNVRYADGSGLSEYRGVVDGEALYVIRGTTDNDGRRVFTSMRCTADGAEHPVGRGGTTRKLWHAKGDCESEAGALGVELWVTELQERRKLTDLGVSPVDEHGVLSLQQMRDVATSYDLPGYPRAEPQPRGTMTITASGARKIAAAVERSRAAACVEGSRWHEPHGDCDGNLPPLPPLVNEYDDGVTVWRVSDRVRVGGPGSAWAADTWRIRSIAVPVDRGAYAGLTLVDRPGGLPIGETGTAIPLARLRRAGAVAPSPDDAQYEIDKLRGALTLADRSRSTWVQRAAEFERQRDELAEQVAKLRETVRVGAEPVAKVLRHLRDDVLPGWVAGSMENDEARGVRDRQTDPELIIFHPADIRAMIADAARESGVQL